ncbi:MAG: hypothetical protein P0111_10395 [Nitrospira sp.]|nr:hypothetical protein [Nitrospira sp.]
MSAPPVHVGSLLASRESSFDVTGFKSANRRIRLVKVNLRPPALDTPDKKTVQRRSEGEAAMWIIAVMLVSLVVLALATMLLERREVE